MWQRQSNYKISDNWQAPYESNHDEVIIVTNVCMGNFCTKQLNN